MSSLRNVCIAVGVAALIIGGEYFFRHYVLFWLPTFGTLLVNDMVALLLCYSLLTAGMGALMHVDWQQELAGVGQALRTGLTRWSFMIGLVALMLSVAALPIVDRLLWGNVALPMFVSSYRNPIVWWAGSAAIPKVVALVFVNGLFVPVAEEYLWRGVVQVRLMGVVAAPFAIGVTAVLFSLKHALVDASLGRLLTLIAFGVICGIVAQRNTWRSSAALHIAINTVTTVTGLVLGLE